MKTNKMVCALIATVIINGSLIGRVNAATIVISDAKAHVSSHPSFVDLKVGGTTSSFVAENVDSVFQWHGGSTSLFPSGSHVEYIDFLIAARGNDTVLPKFIFTNGGEPMLLGPSAPTADQGISYNSILPFFGDEGNGITPVVIVGVGVGGQDVLRIPLNGEFTMGSQNTIQAIHQGGGSWTLGSGYASIVPEPSSILMVCLSSGIALLRRKRL